MGSSTACRREGAACSRVSLPAGLWGLEGGKDERTQGVLGEAERHPEAYVLKPQREGGGNNLYGEQLLEKLRSRQGLAAFILMQRIRPPIQPCAPACLRAWPGCQGAPARELCT